MSATEEELRHRLTRALSEVSHAEGVLATSLQSLNSGAARAAKVAVSSDVSDAYARLRIGIDPPSYDAVDHVLSKFKAGERAAVDKAVADAAQAALTFVRQGAEAAMNKFNAGEEKPKKKSGKSAKA